MSWYEWIPGSLLALIVVLIFLPLIIIIEWLDIIDRIIEEKGRLENKNQVVS